MRKLSVIALSIGTAVLAGCTDNSPPVARVPVTTGAERESRIEYDRVKPLPDQARLYDRDMPEQPPFDDAPLVSQRTPEQGRFETAYRGVGRPRITVFVNRTLEGEIVPLKPREALAEVEHTRMNTGDKFGPADSRETTRVYLHKGQYDEASAKSIDYEAMENILTDFLACQGTVEIMSPTLVRQKLTDEQVKDLQSGRPKVLREMAQQLETDVLIQVTAHPTRQTYNGLEIRLVGEALNVKGGQQVGRAVVDIPPPLEKTALNRYTRFIARKLMMDMTQNWTAVEPKPDPKMPHDPPAEPKPSPDTPKPSSDAPKPSPDTPKPN